MIWDFEMRNDESSCIAHLLNHVKSTTLSASCIMKTKNLSSKLLKAI